MKDNKPGEPSRFSTDPEEKRLGEWLWNQKQAKKGNSNRVFYESNQKIAESNGFPTLFEEA